MCEECDYLNDYKKNNKNKCEKCGDNTKVIMSLVGVSIAVIFILFNEISGINEKIKEKLRENVMKSLWGILFRKSYYHAIVIIMVFHCQVVYLSHSLTFVDIDTKIIDGFQILGDPSKSVSSKLECILGTSVSK